MRRNLSILRSQVNRLEHQLDVLLDISVRAQHVIDRKRGQIREIETRNPQPRDNK